MHEEADVSIPYQVVYLASLGCCSIKVISDDTDIFVLFVHYYAEKKLASRLLMEPTSQGRSSANIGSTVAKHRSIAPQLLSAHASSGCGTVASYFGIGKTKVVKVLEAGNRLNHLGNPSANQRMSSLSQQHSLQHAMVGNVTLVKPRHMYATMYWFPKLDERCMPAAQTESYTTDSGGVQGRHKEGSLSGMHRESCFGRGVSKS